MSNKYKRMAYDVGLAEEFQPHGLQDSAFRAFPGGRSPRPVDLVDRFVIFALSLFILSVAFDFVISRL